MHNSEIEQVLNQAAHIFATIKVVLDIVRSENFRPATFWVHFGNPDQRSLTLAVFTVEHLYNSQVQNLGKVVKSYNSLLDTEE